MGRGAAMMGPKPKVEKGTFSRMFKYITKNYKFSFFIVIICIILASITNVWGMASLKDVIDGYITPLLGTQNPDYGPLLKTILKVACIFVTEIIAVFVYMRLMAIISQSVLRDIRNDLFRKMQKLPIRFFDTRTTGEIMSLYTNDTDTLRQMLSRAFPEFISSAITIVSA